MAEIDDTESHAEHGAIEEQNRSAIERARRLIEEMRKAVHQERCLVQTGGSSNPSD